MMLQLNKQVQYLCSHSSKQFFNRENDIEFILSRETVIALQDNICGEISASTTIIQLPRDKNKSLDRIDSQVSAITLRTSCDLLRRCTNDGGKLCLECDAEHSKLLLGMSKDSIAGGELEERIIGKQWDKNDQNPNHQLCIEKEKGRVFLAYNCPMLGYCELVFPIFFEEYVIAVLFVGQIKLEEKKEIIKSSKENFFLNNPCIFDNYLMECKEKGYPNDDRDKYTCEAIIKHIIDERKNKTEPEYPEIYSIKPGLLIPVVKDELTKIEYDKMVEKVCRWLYNLEKQLDEEIRQKRSNYARDVLAKALSVFHADTAKVNHSYSIMNQSPFYENRMPSIQIALWDPFGEFAKKITEQCAIEYIVVFGARSTQKRTVNILRSVASYKISPVIEIPKYFSLENLSEKNMMNKPTDNRTAQGLFNMLNPKPIDQDNMSIVFQPMKEISAASVAILIKYSSKTIKKSIEGAIISGMQNLAALISSRLAMQFENEAQQLLEKSLRLYKHEMINLSSGLSRAIHDYLGNPNLKDIDAQKVNDVYLDAVSTLEMLEFLSNNIGILIDEPIPPIKKNVQVYQSLLYKWENIRRVDARDKGCDIEFQKSSLIIYTDPRYAEIVVYNLLTNAVKYAYDDTMIYIHCSSPYTQSNDVFSVTNFTFSIHENLQKKIFEMGYRTSDACEYYPEGSGIGLWIVQKIMNILGGRIKLCNPEKISDYNVPLLYTYVNHSELYAGNANEFREAKDEYDRLLNEDVINDFGERQNKIQWIVSNYNWSYPARSKVKKELYKATYKIKFEVYFNV